MLPTVTLPRLTKTAWSARISPTVCQLCEPSKERAKQGESTKTHQFCRHHRQSRQIVNASTEGGTPRCKARRNIYAGSDRVVRKLIATSFNSSDGAKVRASCAIRTGKSSLEDQRGLPVDHSGAVHASLGSDEPSAIAERGGISHRRTRFSTAGRRHQSGCRYCAERRTVELARLRD